MLDTNIFLRVLVPEDEKDHKDCVTLLGKIRKLEIDAVTTGVVLTEVGWVLGSYYKLKRGEVAEKVLGILKLGGLSVIDEYDWSAAFEIYEQQNIKLVDAVLATMPKVVKGELTVVSLDKDFKKLPVKWKLPEDLI